MLYILAKFFRVLEHFPNSAWYIFECFDESFRFVLFLHERCIGDLADEDRVNPAGELGEDFCIGLGIALRGVACGMKSVLFQGQDME